MPHTSKRIHLSRQTTPGELTGSKKKRSLYSHINGDIDTPEQKEQQVVIIEFHRPAENKNNNIREMRDLDLDVNLDDRRLDRFNWDAEEEEPVEEPVEEDENEAESDVEPRTLIEPHYPSIDLFDDDSFIVDERHLEGHTLEDHDSEDETEDALDRLAQNGEANQVWMVDEWEEELEGEMDELMEWIEEDPILNRPEDYPRSSSNKGNNVLGSGRLRDRQRPFADETSRFQRLFSESWLF